MGALPQAPASCLIALMACGLVGCKDISKAVAAGCKADPAEDVRLWQGT